MDAVTLPTSEFLLSDVRAALQRGVTDPERPELSKAFAGWLLGNTEREGELASLVSAAAEREGALQGFQTVAILGFGAAAGILGVEQIAAFKQGLRRQVGREVVIDEVPAAFCSDAVGILGIVLGTKAVGDTELTAQVVKWISRFLKKSCDSERTAEWQRCLFFAADLQLGGSLNLLLPKSRAVADVRTALFAKGIVEPCDAAQMDDDRQVTLTLAVRELPGNLGCERAALRLAAIQSVIETTSPVLAPKSNARPLKQASLSPRDARVHNAVGEERFRTIRNAEILKESDVKKVLQAEHLRPGSDAAKCCLDRIRQTKGYLLSSEIRKKRSKQQ